MCPRSFVSTLMPTPQPPCSGPSRRSAGSWTSVKNTSSNSAPPVICRSGRISMPGRSIGQRKNEMPSCLAASGLLRAMRMPQSLIRPPGAPHLLAVDDEVVAVALGLRRQPSQVAPRARLREQLAPHLVAAQRRAQVLGLLLGRAVHQERAAGQHQADHVQHRRHGRLGALDQPRRLVLRAEALTAVLDRPVDAGVARRRTAAAASASRRRRAPAGRWRRSPVVPPTGGRPATRRRRRRTRRRTASCELIAGPTGPRPAPRSAPPARSPTGPSARRSRPGWRT